MTAYLPTLKQPLSEKIQEAANIIEDAITGWRPSSCWVLWSGGHDSFVTTHLCMTEFGGDFEGVLFLDTGVGIPRTRHLVERYCDEMGWTLEVYEAESYVGGDGKRRPQIYENLVIPPEVRRGELTWLERGGFPGPTETGHGKMFDRLKGRPLEHFIREHKQPVECEDSRLPTHVPDDNSRRAEADYFSDGTRHRQYDRIALITGVYAAESSRRFQLKSGGAIDRSGAKLWVNPCMHWQGHHFDAYRAQAAEPFHNPVYETVGDSGECKCGAFSKPHRREIQDVGEACPELGQRLLDLEEEALSFGYCWRWHEGPPESVVRAKSMLRADDDGQLTLLDDETSTQLCTSCGGGFWKDRDVRQFQGAWEKRDTLAHVKQTMADIRAREPRND